MHTTPPTPAPRFGFALVDAETTGLDATHHRVIEIAVTLVDAAGSVEREWTSLVHVDGETGPVHIHGLTPEHLKDAPTFRQLLPELTELLRGRILVAHNAAFDWGFLSYEAARCGVKLPVSERLCTVNLARQLRIDSPNYKLATLAKHWNIDVGSAHRAQDDTRTLVHILRHCLDEAGRQGAALPLEECHPPVGRSWQLRRRLARFGLRLPGSR